MIPELRALKSLVTPDPAPTEHTEVEHAHWDPVTRTWRPHPQPTAQDEAA